MGGVDSYNMGGVKSITHLIFVYNIVCFSNANVKSFVTLKAVLHEFSIFSGLQFNARKSALIFHKSCDPVKQQLLLILGFTEGSLSFQYLDVPIVGRDLHSNDSGGLTE